MPVILPRDVVIHDVSLCSPEPCPFHNPSDHVMKNFNMVIRMDQFKWPLVERVCPHGVGHPDPDSFNYLIREGRSRGLGIHGCDGCCWPYGKEVQETGEQEDS